MTRVTVKVEGLKESLDNLVDLKNTFGLTNAQGKAVITRALSYAAVPIATAANARAPVGNKNIYSKRLGRLLTPGKLKFIRIGTQTTPSQRRKNPKQSTVEVYVGPAGWPHAHLLEYGTARAAPKPFLRPAADAQVGNVTNRFVSQLKEEVAKAAERAKKRLARLASK